MLKSKFAKKKDAFRARKIFTDRLKPTAAFCESIKAINQKPQEIITYYGKGGIGKSSLLKNLLRNSADVYQEQKDKNFTNIFVSLDAYEYANPVNILMSIRNGIHGDCSLFDYALMQYFAKTKLTLEEIMNKGNVFSSPVMEIINDVLNVGTAQACIPAAALKKCIALIKDFRFKERYRDDIEEIAEFNEFDLFERLPYYLGICISYAAEKGNYHVIYLDSYESVLSRTVGSTPSVDKEEWIKELFLSSAVIRMVIASRERIRWEKEDEEWNNYLNQHLLNNLSKEDSRWFLEQVPITDATVMEAIVENSGGVPLYLDLCVDIYEADFNAGREFCIEPLKKGEKIIDRYIRHLSQKDQYAVKVLSVPRSFDERFARKLLKKQSLSYNSEELQSLLEKSIMLSLEENGMWKVDESVRKHLYAKMNWERKKDIFDDMLACIEKKEKGANYKFFASLMEMFINEPEYLEGVMGKIFRETDFYANAGFWNELHTVFSKYIDSEDERLHSIAVMEELIWFRRTGQLKMADMFASNHPLKKEMLGSWYYMYEYMKIQIRHLLGHYDEAIAGYEKLVDEMTLIRTMIPTHVYHMVCMKYADILFLKGNFKDSLTIVENLLADTDVPVVDQIELLRIKGHIFRFQKQYYQAELIYRSVLKKIKESGLFAYEGKLFTNMTEVLCMTNPSEALEWYKKAEEANRPMGQEIEIGKAQAAASAAFTTMGNVSEGENLAKQAVLTAEKTGYQSGRAFALAALCYAYQKAGNKQKETETARMLKEQLDTVGVYAFLAWKYMDED